jgi:hypothetical protein
MAEIAIPLLALGGFFIMSNQPSNTTSDDIAARGGGGGGGGTREGYVNMGKDTGANSLPNYKVPMENYPVENSATRSNHSRTQDYQGRMRGNESYFDPNNRAQQHRMDNESSHVNTIESMSGIPMSVGEFRHDNMVPFFGSKTTGQPVTEAANAAILDNHQGSGTHHRRKEETAPMFNPGDNVQWNHGMPNHTDFVKSRMNPSMRMANSKPWEETQVAPGLNQGYGTEGNNGFNSGMVARDVWQPPTVDELRVKSNPKITYDLGGHEGPAQSKILKRNADGGRMEKNRPDTDYVNTPDRWLTTTASGYKKPTGRGEHLLHDVNRIDTTTEYFGNGGDAAVGVKADQTYEPATRTEPVGLPISNASATSQHYGPNQDHGKGSVHIQNNNRVSTNHASGSRGNVGGLVNAIIAPILDVLRPTRKTNVVGNPHQLGNVNGGHTRGAMDGSVQRPGTTNRDMTQGKVGSNHWNFQGQSSDAYRVLDMRIDPNNRDTTTTSYSGNAGKTNVGNRSYDADYRQRNNSNKIISNRMPNGGTQIYNGTANMSINKLERDIVNTRNLYPTGMAPAVPSTANQGTMRQPITDESVYSGQSTDRMDPKTLNAFKKNPFTQSLSSW